MHLAAHHWMRPEPLEVTLARLQRFGYEGIGIVGEPDRYPIEEEGLKEICSFAAERGIRISLEPQNRFSTYFLNRVDQTLVLAKEVGFNCGIAYDAFHASIEEKDMYAALQSCGPYLADFHVAENNRLAPGDGLIDWPRIVKILDEIGYEGSLAMECIPKIDRVPPPSFQRTQGNQDGLAAVKPGLLPPMEEHVSNVVSEEYFSSLLEKTAAVIGPLLRKSGGSP